MKKGAIIFVLLVLSISYISAIVSFPASNVSVKIGGTDRTLQYAIDNSLLKGSYTYALSASIAIGQHDASQVWVSVENGEMTLLQAMQSYKLCPKSGNPITYANPAPNPGHYATEVKYSATQSVQDVINTGIFCGCAPGATKSCIGSSAECTYSTVTCTTLGNWPFCYKARGTACNTADDWHTCDGSGNCQGWSGTGCYNNNPNSCPFGDNGGTGGTSASYTYCNQEDSNGLKYQASYYSDLSKDPLASYTGWTPWYAAAVCHGLFATCCSPYGCDFCNNQDFSWKMKPRV